MTNLTPWLIPGIVIGILAGMMVGHYGTITNLQTQYDTMLLTTLPGVDPTVCYIAEVHKDYPAFDCSTMQPIDAVGETPADTLTPDGVYVGSLTFAGLAMFGFAILGKALFIGKGDTWKQNFGADLVRGGTLFIIILHVLFAFQTVSIPVSWIAVSTVLAVILIMIGAVLLAPRRKESEGEEQSSKEQSSKGSG